MLSIREVLESDVVSIRPVANSKGKKDRFFSKGGFHFELASGQHFEGILHENYSFIPDPKHNLLPKLEAFIWEADTSSGSSGYITKVYLTPDATEEEKKSYQEVLAPSMNLTENSQPLFSFRYLPLLSASFKLTEAIGEYEEARRIASHKLNKLLRLLDPKNTHIKN